MTDIDERSPEDLEAAQAAWRAEQVESFVARGFDREIATAGVEWGVHWMEDHIRACQEQFGDQRAPSRNSILAILNDAYNTSFSRTSGIPRYPTGMPALRAIIIASETLVDTQPPEDREIIADLLLSLNRNPRFC